jgi:predicted flap endonuclease-1-like 5' DNA nuclease
VQRQNTSIFTFFCNSGLCRLPAAVSRVYRRQCRVRCELVAARAILRRRSRFHRNGHPRRARGRRNRDCANITGSRANHRSGSPGQTPAKKTRAAAPPDPKPKTEAAPAAPDPKPAPAKAKADPDDLRRIEGIGPKIASALIAQGIDTFEKLSKQSLEELQSKVKAEGVRFSPSAESWAEQASYAAKGDWDGLQTLQDTLIGGRYPKS